jgi:hypothetical protein
LLLFLSGYLLLKHVFLLGFSSQVNQDGSLEGPFDVVIVADGRKSIRASMPSVQSRTLESWYKFGCFWAVLPGKHSGALVM